MKKTDDYQKRMSANEAQDKADGPCGFAALVQVLRESHVLSESEVERVVKLKDEYLQKYAELTLQLMVLVDEQTQETLLGKKLQVTMDPVVVTMEKFVALRLMSPMRLADYKRHLTMAQEGKEALSKLPEEILTMDDPQPAMDKIDEIAALGVMGEGAVKALKASLLKIWRGRNKKPEGEDDAQN